MHANTYTDSIESLDDDNNELVPPLKVPPATDDIKKEVIDGETSNVSAQCKLEPDSVEMDNKPIIDRKNLLSLDKLNASGMLIANKEKPNDELTSSIEKNKNENALDQLKSLLITQSAQAQKQTDLLLPLMASISDKTNLALCELDKTGVVIIDVKTEMVDVKTDLLNKMVDVKNEMVNIKSDTDLIKAEVATFQSNLFKVKDDMVKVENKIEIVDQKFNKEIVKVKV